MLNVLTRQWILENGFNPDQVDEPGKHNDTPLMVACRRGETGIAEALIDAGADIGHKNMDGTNALWACVVSDSFELASKLLSEGADIDNQNDNGATVLMYASSAGKDKWVAYFLEKGANTQLVNHDDFSALDLASTIECLRLLRKK